MEDEKKKEALRVYEETVREATGARNNAIEMIKEDFKTTVKEAHRVYKESTSEQDNG